MQLDFTAVITMFFAGWVATYMWRFAGASLVRSIKPSGQLMLWVRAVAIAIVAALCTKIALTPPQIVAETYLASRIASMAAGIVGFYAFRHTGLGVVVAVAVFIAAELIF